MQLDELENRVRNHGVHAQLQRTDEVLASYAADDPAPANYLNRCRQAVSEAIAALQVVDPLRITQTMLDNLCSAVVGVLANLEQYSAGNGGDYVTTAYNFAEEVFDRVATLPLRTPEVDVDAARRSIEQLSTGLSDREVQLRAQIEAMRVEVEALRGQVVQVAADDAVRVAEMTSRLDEVKSITDTEAARSTAIVTDLQARADSAINGMQERRETIASNVQQQLSQLLVEQRAKGEVALTDFTTEAATTIANAGTEAQAALDRLEELRNEAADLVGLVAGNATAGGFKVHADKEKSAADVWRLVALVAAAVAIGWAALIAASHDSETFEWSEFAGKIAVSVPVAAFATYAGSQSSSHRGEERRARRMQLELVAIDPLLESLSDAERTKIKAEYVPRVFGQLHQSTSDETETTRSLLSILANAVGNLTKK